MPATQAARHFLDDVLADPADDGIRLIYADWLEDHGDAARAEFIRVQIEAERRGGRCLKRPPATSGAVPLSMCCVVCDLKGREQELLKRLVDSPSNPRWEFDFAANAWFGFFFDRVGQIDRVFRRGFVGEIALPLEAFLEHAAELFRDHPITTVRLTDKVPRKFPLNVWWYCRRCGGVLDADDLPTAIFNELLGDKIVGGRRGGVSGRKYYDSEAAALSALSAACVAHGRDLAKLPPLPPAISQTPSP